MYRVPRGGDPGTKKRKETVSWDFLEIDFVEQACRPETVAWSETLLEMWWLHGSGSLELRRLKQEDRLMSSRLAWIGRVRKGEERCRVRWEELETSSSNQSLWYHDLLWTQTRSLGFCMCTIFQNHCGFSLCRVHQAHNYPPLSLKPQTKTTCHI